MTTTLDTATLQTRFHEIEKRIAELQLQPREALRNYFAAKDRYAQMKQDITDKTTQFKTLPQAEQEKRQEAFNVLRSRLWDAANVVRAIRNRELTAMRQHRQALKDSEEYMALWNEHREIYSQLHPELPAMQADLLKELDNVQVAG